MAVTRVDAAGNPLMGRHISGGKRLPDRNAVRLACVERGNPAPLRHLTVVRWPYPLGPPRLGIVVRRQRTFNPVVLDGRRGEPL